MVLVTSLVFFLTCVAMTVRMVRSRDVLDVQLGVVGLFSVGYFCLPAWFRSSSQLEFIDELQLERALLVFLIFLWCVLIGVFIGRRLKHDPGQLQTPSLDRWIYRHQRPLSVGCFAYFVYHYSTTSLTSYSATDFKAYFTSNTGLSALSGVAQDIALGILAILAARAVSERRRLAAAWYIGMIGIATIMLVLVGQRLAVLTPIFMMIAAFALSGQARRSVRFVAVGIACLLVVSPLAVAIRQAPAGADAASTVSNFSFGENPVQTSLDSILARGDLLYVASEMLPRIDNDPFPGPIYYASVLVNPIPASLFLGGTKPYLLSVNGSSSGELSIYAWRSLHSSDVGSLSAFGGLVAYRELGWSGVVLNGLATGMLFVLIFLWLGRGGLFAGAVYASLFVSFAVRKVPPSFWEVLGTLAPYLPILFLVWLLNRRSGSPEEPIVSTRALGV